MEGEEGGVCDDKEKEKDKTFSPFLEIINTLRDAVRAWNV